jgi:hypothetical protein
MGARGRCGAAGTRRRRGFAGCRRACARPGKPRTAAAPRAVLPRPLSGHSPEARWVYAQATQSCSASRDGCSRPPRPRRSAATRRRRGGSAPRPRSRARRVGMGARGRRGAAGTRRRRGFEGCRRACARPGKTGQRAHAESVIEGVADQVREVILEQEQDLELGVARDELGSDRATWRRPSSRWQLTRLRVADVAGAAARARERASEPWLLLAAAGLALARSRARPAPSA